MFKGRIASLLSDAAGKEYAYVLPTIEESKHADYHSKVAFLLAKEERKNPAQIAARLVGEIEKPYWLKEVRAEGPYINFFLSDEAFSEAVSHILSTPSFGKPSSIERKKILVEFPSVNPNKPWHAGHLRNALLGDVLSNLLSFMGHEVIRMDYVDDLGLQVAQTIWAVRNLKEGAGEEKFDHYLGKLYVKAQGKWKEEGVREILRALERGDEEARKVVEECVKAQYQTAFSFGIFHHFLVFESDIVALSAEGMEMLKRADAIVLEKEGKNAGCWVVKLDYDFGFGKMKDPDKVLIRSDGTLVYTGKDVIFHLWKAGMLKRLLHFKEFISQPNGWVAFASSSQGQQFDLSADWIVNVIGKEQQYPQAVVREVLKKLGFKGKYVHVAYEHVVLPEGRFSGRKGTWVGYSADDLFEECVQRLEGREAREAVANAAIRYSFLKVHPLKRIVFKWEEALNMEGDSGPYVQYACVRAKSILRKAAEGGEVKESSPHAYSLEAEKALIKHLLLFPDVVEKSAYSFSPPLLVRYVGDCAYLFTRFYENAPVLKAEGRVKESRVALLKAFLKVMNEALSILGIPIPERM